MPVVSEYQCTTEHHGGNTSDHKGGQADAAFLPQLFETASFRVAAILTATKKCCNCSAKEGPKLVSYNKYRTRAAELLLVFFACSLDTSSFTEADALLPAFVGCAPDPNSVGITDAIGGAAAEDHHPLLSLPLHEQRYGDPPESH